jgi:hypothetical protein
MGACVRSARKTTRCPPADGQVWEVKFSPYVNHRAVFFESSEYLRSSLGKSLNAAMSVSFPELSFSYQPTRATTSLKRLNFRLRACAASRARSRVGLRAFSTIRI